MKILSAIALLIAACGAYAEEKWKTVDEGFQMTLPSNWRKQKVHPIDSNCGTYRAPTADLEFDEVYGLGYTAKESQSQIDELKKKEANPKLLKPGEEIWHVDGRIARYTVGKLDPEVYGKRRFSNVAYLHVPYPEMPGYLTIYIIYKSDGDLAAAKRVLQSIKWKVKSSKK